MDSINLESIKASNPKDCVGIQKVPIRSRVPAPVVGEIALALLEGARKYGAFNWRVAGVRASVYVDALGRHVDAWWDGEDTDPDSGLSHVTKAIATLVVLRDAMLQDKWNDDRPPRSKAGWIAAQNQKAAEIIDRVRPGDPVAPYTERGRSTWSRRKTTKVTTAEKKPRARTRSAKSRSR